MTALDTRPQQAFRYVVWGGFLLMLGASLPGHLSYDSLAQLLEGRLGVRETWGPPLYAVVLGAFDRIIPGTSLYVIASGLLLFGSLATLPRLRPRTQWLAVPLTFLLLLTPQLLIAQAIVWKDILFANTAVAALICLAHASRSWGTGRCWAYLVAALALLACASQFRQNGIIVAVVASMALGWIASRGSWRRGAAWAAAGMTSVVLTSYLIATASLASLETKSPDAVGSGVAFGVRIIQLYDLAGAASIDPTYEMPALATVDAQATRTIQLRASLAYSPERVDFLDRDAGLSGALSKMPPDAVNRQWLALVLQDPWLYVRVRAAVFRWLLAPPEPAVCLPIVTGIDARPEKLGPLNMSPRRTDADAQLSNYVSWVQDTPVYSHAAYLLISLILTVVLLIRRENADIAMAALQLSGLAFAATFFVISIACDNRYLYFSDLAAIVGIVYFAIDPYLRDSKAKRGRAGV